MKQAELVLVPRFENVKISLACRQAGSPSLTKTQSRLKRRTFGWSGVRKSSTKAAYE